MSAVLWTAGSACVLLGVYLIALGASRRVRPRRRHSVDLVDWSSEVVLRGALAAGAGLLTLLASGWVAAAALAATGAALSPDFLRSARQRKAGLERAHAIGEWTSMLRGLTGAGMGLSAAITSSTTHAPTPIRDAVQRLGVDQGGGAIPALIRFADEVDDQLCDLVVNLLIFASTGQAARLGDALDRLASDIAAEAESRERIEDARARMRANVRSVAIVALVFGPLFVAANPAWFAAYDGAQGQVRFGIWASMFLLMVWMWARMDRPRRRIRLRPTDPRQVVAGWN